MFQVGGVCLGHKIDDDVCETTKKIITSKDEGRFDLEKILLGQVPNYQLMEVILITL